MISKSELMESALREVRISKQLLTNMPEGGWDYRPTPKQRSMLELARYICAVGQGTLHAAKDGSFKWFGEHNERFQALTIEEIPGEMDKEMAEMERLFGEISDDAFANAELTVEGMGNYTLRGWLTETTLKFLTAYKLQLFLYLKSAGASEINTMDAWRRDGSPEPAGA